MTTTTPADLGDRQRGDLIVPTDGRYDDARRLYNGISRTPVPPCNRCSTRCYRPGRSSNTRRCT